MFMPFHLMKTYIKNSETEAKLFLCPSTSSDTDGCAVDTSAHIYARRGFFFELVINDNLGWGTLGDDMVGRGTGGASALLAPSWAPCELAA